jgi:F0F1-type ATP synthase assembly protein I
LATAWSAPGGRSTNERKDEESSNLAAAYRRAAPFVDAVWQLVGAVGVGTLGGYFLDKHWDTTPWMLLAGAVVGMAAGMTAFIRNTLRIGGTRRGK